ncbi:MAG: flagellar type III secretion system protein FliR [Schwartzia sp.]|nr:flagellar type III secretion system protein FliR [Schwartzia sp. (in: firmicutes)]
MDLFELLQNHAAVFLLTLTRISGLFMMSPFFGSINIPINFRAATAFAITLVVFPVVDSRIVIEAPPTVIAFAFVVLKELFIGWLIGFVAYISFAVINMAGKVMDMQVGFSIVNVVDPTSGQQIPLIGSFLYNLGLIVFLVTNGHHMLIAALVGSFESIPLLSLSPGVEIVGIIARFTTGIFTTGLQIALPVTFAIFMTNVALGMLARTMPQLNIFVVGVPMHLMIGLFVLGVVLAFYVLFLDVVFNGMYGNISIILRNL